MDVRKPRSGPARIWSRLPVLAFALVLIVVAGVWIAARGSSPLPAHGPGYLEVRRGTIEGTITALGSLQSDGVLQIAARHDGRVVELAARPGERVNQGGVLLKLYNERLEGDLADAQIRLAQMRGEVAMARAQAAADLQSEESALRKAMVGASYARAEFDARERVYKQGVVSQMQVAEAHSRLEIALADLHAAKSRVAAARQITAVRVQSKEFEYGIVEEQHGRAKDAVESGSILAPASGVVSQVDVELGASVSAGQALIRFDAGGGKYVRLSVPEDEAFKLRAGLPVHMESVGYQFAGSVRRIFPVVKDGYVTAEVKIAGQERALPAIDSTVRGEIQTDTLKDAMFVSVDGLAPAEQEVLAEVEHADGSRSINQKIRLGSRFGRKLVVLEGVVPGDRLMLDVSKGEKAQ